MAEVDEHIGVAMSGLTADARTLIEHARVETQVRVRLFASFKEMSALIPARLTRGAGAQQHRFSYNEPMPVESCTQALCDLALRFGENDDDEESGGMVGRCVGFVRDSPCKQL